MRKLLGTAALSALLLVTGCETVQTTRGGVVGVERKQSMLMGISTNEANQMAAKQYAAELNAAKQKGKLNTDAKTLERLRMIANRLIPQTGEFRPDALKWDWEVNLESSDELNAYCAPGGKIMFYSGLINRLKLNNDEIAAIMGHEMAHALREHGREAMSRAYTQQLGLSVVALTGKVSDQALQLANSAVTVAWQLPNSRENETEADRIGLELAARAGYDPRAAVTVWKKMTSASEGQPPQWMSTHPSHGTRIRDLEDKIPLVMPLYEAAKKP
ncbi:putative Zn-dependent protease [Chitinivorax tropicus]|uniref:Putative Zn-dependent protease n=1 Tax=Chitinivorax tropicus TaxID=714531 RepID=A0A840MRH3_9PROT|nr:M48 family metallopeptidase [Chitinivorax tropicus]MBB5019382.1 putative Zn-dependent protease [Chitinivorax tropicus]